MHCEVDEHGDVTIVSHFPSSSPWMGVGDGVAWACRRMRRYHLTWNQGVTMSQSLVDLQIDNTILDPLDAAITQMETSLAGLISLTPEQRRALMKMGEKSEAFCRAALNVAQQHSGIMARDFDIDAFQRDQQTLDLLRPRILRIAHLYQRVVDTEMALGSDQMVAALEVYGALKVAGKGKSLDEARRSLSARWRVSSQEPEAPPAGEGGN